MLTRFVIFFEKQQTRAICSKSDLWNFDGFQTKPLWKLEMLQKLLLLKVFFTKVKKTHNYFLFWQCFLIIFMRQAVTDDFRRLHKNKNCTFPLSLTSHSFIDRFLQGSDSSVDSQWKYQQFHHYLLDWKSACFFIWFIY